MLTFNVDRTALAHNPYFATWMIIREVVSLIPKDQGVVFETTLDGDDVVIHVSKANRAPVCKHITYYQHQLWVELWYNCPNTMPAWNVNIAHKYRINLKGTNHDDTRKRTKPTSPVAEPKQQTQIGFDESETRA